MRRAGDSLQPIDIGALRERDPRAVAAQFAAHHDVLSRAARRVGFAGTEAEELVQSVWTTFLEILPRFEGRSQVRTFLLGILRRKAAEARRQRGREATTDPATLDTAIASAGDPHAALEDARLGTALSSCVRALPEAQRRAVELKILEERETAAVGREMGVTPNHLGVLLHRARAYLRECVIPYLT